MRDMLTFFHTLAQTGIPKEVISPLLQYSFVGGFCILFMFVSGYLYFDQKKQRQLDKDDAKKREDEMLARMMNQFDNQFNTMAGALKETNGIIGELKGIIRENTVTFTKVTTLLDRLERKT